MSQTLLALADDLLDHGGVVVSVRGRSVPLSPTDPDPFGLLGVRFGRAVDAVAIGVGRARPAPAVDDGRAGPVLAVDRRGEAIVVDTGRRGVAVDGAPLLLDLARRSLGLTTAGPDRPVGQLVDAVWLERVLRCTLDAPLGEPPGWLAIARLHPGGRTGPPSSPELLRHRATTAPGWSALRRDVAEGRVRWPPVSSVLARWFDEGSMARHVFAVLPEPETVLGDLHELLRPIDADRVEAAISRR